MHDNADGSLVSYFFFINLVLEDALGHEQEQYFIRGRENLTGGVKWRGREVGGEGGSGGKGEGSGEWVPPVHPLFSGIKGAQTPHGGLHNVS